MNIVLSPVERLERARLIDVHAAWRKVAAGRMAPKREEITPALLKTALPSVWMIDVIEGGKDFRFRLAGDRLIQFMGRRYAGSPLSEFLDQPFFQHMRTILLAAVRGKRPFVIGPGRSRMPGKEHIELEVVVLPLSDDGENVTTIFGAMEIGPISGKKLPKGQP
jgi:hypothetical protein